MRRCKHLFIKLMNVKKMKEIETKLPKYKIDFIGILVLLAGGIIPSMGLVVLVTLYNLFLGGNIALETNTKLSLIINLVMWLGAIFAYNFLVCRRQTGRHLKFNFSIKPFWLLIIIPMMFGMMLITEFISSLIPTEGAVFGELYQYYTQMIETLSQDVFSMVLMVVIMAPIFEEIVFRGIIMKGLIHSGRSSEVSVWVSAILFGLVHANPWQLVGGILLGFVLGKVYQHTQSLLMPIILHMFNNLVSVLLLYMGIESFGGLFGMSSYTLLFIGLGMFSLFYYLFFKYIKG